MKTLSMALTLLGLSLAASSLAAEDDAETVVKQPPIVENRAGWLLGVVEPALIEAASRQATVNALVFLRTRLTDKQVLGESLQDIKERHDAGQDALSSQIRAIHNSYRPQGYMSPDAERAYAETANQKVSAVDRQRLRDLHMQMDDALHAERREVSMATARLGVEERNEVAGLVRSLGGTVRQTLPLVNALAVTMPAGGLPALAASDLTHTIVLDRERQKHLNVSVPSVGFDTWNNAGFDGDPYDAALPENVRGDHPDFAHLFRRPISGNSGDADHGTHVAGIMASGDSTHRSGAPDIERLFYGETGNSSSNIFADMDAFMTEWTDDSPEVINHSIGYNCATDADYNNIASFYDAYVNNYSTLVVTSAGNSGWGGTVDQNGDCLTGDDIRITHPVTAYNLLSVANMDDKGTLGRLDDRRAASSSIGPTLGDRRKPDISAPGTNIKASNADWQDFLAPLHDDKTGTSMAAPHVAAAVILLEDGGNNSPMAQRAVLINTATPWVSNNTASTSDDGQRATLCSSSTSCPTLWDKSYGWGYLDMDKAFVHRGDYFNGSVVADNNNGLADDFKYYLGYMDETDKVTLVWERRSSIYSSTTPRTDNMYDLTDLDLAAYDEANNQRVDSDTTTSDNVHQLAVSFPRVVVVKVNAYSSTVDGRTSEPYVLATPENFQPVAAPTYALSASGVPPLIAAGESFTLTINGQNLGEIRANSVTIGLGSLANFSGDNSSNTLPFGLQPGSSGSASFTVSNAGLPTGTHALPYYVQDSSYGETHRSDGTITLNVDADPPSSDCTSPAFARGSTITVFPANVTDVGPAGVNTNLQLWVKKPGDAQLAPTSATYEPLLGQFFYRPSPPIAPGLYEFAVQATDTVGNVEPVTAVECSTIHDAVAPTGSISVASGAVSTGSVLVDLSLPASDANGVVSMRLSNDLGATWTEIPYAASISNWDLSASGGNAAPGIKTVQVQFFDPVGNESIIYSDSIELAEITNDSFSAPADLMMGITNGNLSGASNDGSSSVGLPDQPDVWYAYTAPGPGTLRLNTCGSNEASGVDTTLSVHSNTGVPGSADNELIANDDFQFGNDPTACGVFAVPDAGKARKQIAARGGNPTLNSALLLDLTAGQSVLIRVSQYQPPSAAFILTASFEPQVPANDAFTNATVIAPSGGVFEGTLFGASNDGSNSVGLLGMPDVWFSYSPPGPGTLLVHTCGTMGASGLDTTVSLHLDTGVAGSAANEVVANDDFAGGNYPDAPGCDAAFPLDSAIAADVAGGEAFLLRVSEYQGPESAFVLNVSFDAAAPDTDGDSITDDVDNCTLDVNPAQLDTDNDGIGNVCDGDIATPNDCAINFQDLGVMKAAFFSAPGDANWNPDADMVGVGDTPPDSTVNFFDLGRLKGMFFNAPGPSAAGCN